MILLLIVKMIKKNDKGRYKGKKESGVFLSTLLNHQWAPRKTLGKTPVDCQLFFLPTVGRGPLTIREVMSLSVHPSKS